DRTAQYALTYNLVNRPLSRWPGCGRRLRKISCTAMIELEPRKDASAGRDPDGVRIVARDASGRRRQRAFQGVALFLAAACAGYVLMPRQVSEAGSADTTRVPETKQTIRSETASHPVIGTGSGAQAAGAKDAVAASTANAAGAAAASGSHRITPRRASSRHSSQNADDDPGQQPEFVGIPRDVTAAEYIQALHDAG